MNIRSRFPVVAIIIMALALSVVASDKKPAKLPKRVVDKTKITWLPYDKAVAYGKSEKKHLLIDFTTTWCGWCKKMDRETFADSSVVKLVNEHFIPAKVWADQDTVLDIEGYKITQAELARTQYKVSGYPCFWFLAPDKKQIGPIAGYRDTEYMLSALTWVKDYRYDTTRTNTTPAKSATGSGKQGN